MMNETLSVIDEHITDMNTPRSSLIASDLRGVNDSGSEYSNNLDHRLSYINGNETDEEERTTYSEAEVSRWTPKQVAEYLQDSGVERRHCEVFMEQEISGEVLLSMDQASIFMKEFDLGLVGRRLRTWHKIKAFQDEVRLHKNLKNQSSIGEGSVDSFDRTMGRSSANSSMLPKIPSFVDRSPAMRQNLQGSPKMAPEYAGAEKDSVPGTPRVHPPDSPSRPSAASIREFSHSRRHSSIDFNSKSDTSSFVNLKGSSTPPRSPTVSHKKQPSYERNWTMSAFPPATTNRTSMALGLSALGMTGHALSISTDRNTFDPNILGIGPGADGSTDLDRGYTSSGEVEGRRFRNVLRKNHPASASHSRQNSYKDEHGGNGLSVSKRHSRFGSTGSIRDAIASVTSSGSKNSLTDSQKSRSRTLSFKSSTTPSSFNNDVSPVVTKLEYSESPTSLTSPKPGSGSPAKQDASAQNNQTSPIKARSELRSSSDAITGTEKALISSPINLSAPSKESPLQSPTRTGSTTPSAASKSLELESTDHSTKSSATPAVGLTPISGNKRAKNKKDTSAYQKGLLKISPRDSMKECDYSGWMKKKSAKVTSTWKPRLFVLRGRRLSYYYTEEDRVEKGLIDISSHRVMPADNEFLTGLHATLTGAKSSPTSPANAQTATMNAKDGNPPKPNEGEESMFIFKLVPPRTGLSRAVNFTKPSVHYFAVDGFKQGRSWMNALMKATIDRDESKPITSTYQQKTITLNKAQSMKHRPPALMGLDENTGGNDEVAGSKDALADADEAGLNIQGLNLSYEYIASDATKETNVNGTAEVYSSTNRSASAPLPQDETSKLERPESDEKDAKDSVEENPEGPAKSSLRMVKSLSSELRERNVIGEALERSLSALSSKSRASSHASRKQSLGRARSLSAGSKASTSAIDEQKEVQLFPAMAIMR